ncbi:hypothetical protein QTO34_015493 [Cnephaeus nilssonii]|uniref:Uncharacterized protein n=1 Tax=Cnephaeus nilssonii TaxID=3371016 RepID=A0AA40I477_CNENI|nr:hypothetical protein QTO34_015493 [Eptesicus nilssonii]
MLTRYIGALSNHLENAEMVYENQVASTCEVKRKKEKWREELDYECKELKCSLEVEQDDIDNHLLIEENDVEEKLIGNGRQISYCMFRLCNLLTEIAEKCLQTDENLLTSIESIHNTYENLETLAIFSYKLKDSKTVASRTPGEQKIGVFLDYELGAVSFYNLNNWSYLYRITDRFTAKLKPHFSSASSSEPLAISIIRV